MAVGKVKWWDVKKGFGFVVSAENVDVFVHFSVIQDEGFRRLKNDEVVEYEAIENGGRLCATVVRRSPQFNNATAKEALIG